MPSSTWIGDRGQPAQKVRLGISYEQKPVKNVAYSQGLMISALDAQGPAAAAGLRPADYLLTVNGKVVALESALRDALDLPSETAAEFLVARSDGKVLQNLKISLRLSPRAGRKGW